MFFRRNNKLAEALFTLSNRVAELKQENQALNNKLNQAIVTLAESLTANHLATIAEATA